jgi:hypothetical protein
MKEVLKGKELLRGRGSHLTMESNSARECYDLGVIHNLAHEKVGLAFAQRTLMDLKDDLRHQLLFTKLVNACKR